MSERTRWQQFMAWFLATDEHPWLQFSRAVETLKERWPDVRKRRIYVIFLTGAWFGMRYHFMMRALWRQENGDLDAVRKFLEANWKEWRT